MKWLMKSELDVYPWSQLVEDGSTHWDGVRNYQARNFMRDEMERGETRFLVHKSNDGHAYLGLVWADFTPKILISSIGDTAGGRFHKKRRCIMDETGVTVRENLAQTYA